MTLPEDQDPSFRWQLRLVIVMTVLIVVAFLGVVYGMIRTAMEL